MSFVRGFYAAAWILGRGGGTYQFMRGYKFCEPKGRRGENTRETALHISLYVMKSLQLAALNSLDLSRE
jgi:hypothetical protein